MWEEELFRLDFCLFLLCSEFIEQEGWSEVLSFINIPFKGSAMHGLWREEEAKPLVCLTSAQKILVAFPKTLKYWRTAWLIGFLPQGKLWGVRHLVPVAFCLCYLGPFLFQALVKNPTVTSQKEVTVATLTLAFLAVQQALCLIMRWFLKVVELLQTCLFSMGKEKSSAGGSVGPGSSIEFGAPFLGEITALLHVLSDLSSGFPPLPNLPVTCSFREHLKVFIDLL